LHLFAAFAEMERQIIRERVRAGVRAAKAKGTRLGRPQPRLSARPSPTPGPGHELLFQRDGCVDDQAMRLETKYLPLRGPVTIGLNSAGRKPSRRSGFHSPR
jgi:hypothetical protein